MSVFGFFLYVFSRIWTEYGKVQNAFLYSVQIQENMDQKNSKYGHFSRSARFKKELTLVIIVGLLYSIIWKKKVD